MLQPTDKCLVKKIHTQALSPKNVDIRIHMYKATVKKMLSKVDQENFQKEIKGRKQGNPEGPFSLDLAPYPLQKLWLPTPLRQMKNMLKLILLKSSYLYIKQLGRGLWRDDMEMKLCLWMLHRRPWDTTSTLLPCGKKQCELYSGWGLYNPKWDKSCNRRSTENLSSGNHSTLLQTSTKRKVSIFEGL